MKKLICKSDFSIYTTKDKKYPVENENDRGYFIEDDTNTSTFVYKEFIGKFFNLINDEKLVKCIDDKQFYLTLNKEYEVKNETETHYKITSDDGKNDWYLKKRFVPVVEKSNFELALEQNFDGIIGTTQPLTQAQGRKLDEELKAVGDIIESTSKVDHPNHYQAGKYECREVMKELLKRKNDGYEATQFSNVFKYVWRYDLKNGLEDLKKAQNYLNELVNYMEDKENEKEF